MLNSRRLMVMLAIPVIFLAVTLGKAYYLAPRLSTGTEAPTFAAALPNGDSINLRDFKGRLVLIDFWASWCGPCRADNPKIVDLYRKYSNAKFRNASGFDIISVSLDANRGAWLNAVQADGLIWPHHVSDLKRFDDHVAQLFEVKSIPQKYLLDQNGIIIGVDPTAEQLDKLLAKRLN